MTDSESTILIRKLVADMAAAGAHSAAGIAGSIARDYPEDVAAWLDEHSFELFRGWVGDLLRSWRIQARHRRPTLEELGERDGSARWLDMSFPVDAAGNRLPMRLIDRNGARYIADDYRESATRDLFFEAKWRYIAKRLRGAAVIGDVFTEEDLDRLFTTEEAR